MDPKYLVVKIGSTEEAIRMIQMVVENGFADFMLLNDLSEHPSFESNQPGTTRELEVKQEEEEHESPPPPNEPEPEPETPKKGKRRRANPMYIHEGFLLRFVKKLSDGSELLYCDKRKTHIGCTAIGRRTNGSIELKKPHHGHEREDRQASAKIARYELKERAASSTVSPRQLLLEATNNLGMETVALSGSKDSLSRMIHRARKRQRDFSEDQLAKQMKLREESFVEFGGDETKSWLTNGLLN